MARNLREILLDFLRGLMRPIAVFCLRRGIKIQDLIETAKAVFIEVAAKDLAAKHQSPSTSRLAVMTGLHRRDVMRLTNEKRDKTKEESSLLIRILGQWQNDKRFSKNKKPRALSIEGMGSEFSELIQSVSKDLNPYTVLFELERIGAVKRSGDKLSLTMQAYAPVGDVRESLNLLSSDTEDLILAVEENIFAGQKVPNLHIKTFYDNIVPEYLPEIKEWFLEKGAKFHQEARQYLSQFDKDLNPRLYDKIGGARVAVGSFSRIENVQEKDSEEEDVA